MPINRKPNGRFELPLLTPINFNLTDGTDIPPPPDSPIEETSKPTTAASPPPDPIPQVSPPDTISAPATSESENHTTNTNGLHSSSHSQPQSIDKPSALRTRTPSDISHNIPSSPTRPNSIRKFLSRKSLNTNYTNGGGTVDPSHEELTQMGRPDSPSSLMSSKPSLKRRKSGSWFRAFGSSSNSAKKGTVMHDSKVAEQNQVQTPPVLQERATVNENRKPMGPPPPKLPELNQLKAKIADDDEGSLGGADMFKNIS